MIGLSRFCPDCFAVEPWDAETCAACGALLERDDRYDDRLIWALGHPDTERAMLAADLLARRATAAAIGPLIELTAVREPYRAAAAARALAAFDDDRARAFVRRLHAHPSFLVRQAVSRTGMLAGSAPAVSSSAPIGAADGHQAPDPEAPT